MNADVQDGFQVPIATIVWFSVFSFHALLLALTDCSSATTSSSDNERFTGIIEDEWSSSTSINWWTASTSAWTCERNSLFVFLNQMFTFRVLQNEL
jgi:hypothetical protein